MRQQVIHPNGERGKAGVDARPVPSGARDWHRAQARLGRSALPESRRAVRAIGCSPSKREPEHGLRNSLHQQVIRVHQTGSGGQLYCEQILRATSSENQRQTLSFCDEQKGSARRAGLRGNDRATLRPIPERFALQRRFVSPTALRDP